MRFAVTEPPSERTDPAAVEWRDFRGGELEEHGDVAAVYVSDRHLLIFNESYSGYVAELAGLAEGVALRPGADEAKIGQIMAEFRHYFEMALQGAIVEWRESGESAAEPTPQTLTTVVAASRAAAAESIQRDLDHQFPISGERDS